MTDRAAQVVLLIDTDPGSSRRETLTNAGFVVRCCQDIRAVGEANRHCAANVVVHMAAHFAPSVQSAFEALLQQVGCPVIVVDHDERRGLELVRAGASDLIVVDGEGLYLSQLIQRVCVAVVRQGRRQGAGGVPDQIVKFVESIPFGALLADGEGRILVANADAERVVGSSADEPKFWFANLALSREAIGRMRASGVLDLGEAVFNVSVRSQARVELNVRRIRGSADEEYWLVLLRDLAAGELSVRQLLESDRARRLVEHSGDLLLLHDTEGRIVDVNHQSTAQTGYTRDELLNLRIWDLDKAARPGAGIWAKLSAGGALTVEGSIRRKDDSEFPVEVRLGAWEDRGEKRIVAWLRDISERRGAEEEQRLARIVFDAVSEGIMVTDRENRIFAVNPAFTRITEFDEAQALGKAAEFLFAPDHHDAAFVSQVREAVDQQGHWEGEVWSRTRSGAVFPEWLSMSAVRGHDGSVDRIVSVFTNITERKRVEDMMRRQALHDPLTGLANRLLFHQQLKAALQSADERNTHVALLYIDLDHFKPVNDRHGHHVGDQLLKQVAERLISCGRRSDTVARLGGDEFAMILPDLDRVDFVAKVPKRVLDALNRPFDLDGGVVGVSGSVGVTYYPDHSSQMDELLRFADAAMYRAKQVRNQFCVFDPADPPTGPVATAKR